MSKFAAVMPAVAAAAQSAGARNMGRLLDLAGRKKVPVFAGRNTPLRGAAEFPGEWRRLSDDLPVERLRSARMPVQILALGLLINTAEAERVPGNLRGGGESALSFGANSRPNPTPRWGVSWPECLSRLPRDERRRRRGKPNANVGFGAAAAAFRPFLESSAR